LSAPKCCHLHSITAGAVFHKTRTDLRKWFMAAYPIDHDKRSVSALMVGRELAIRYDTAWLTRQKLRHALADDNADFKLEGLIEIDEVFFGGRKQKGNRGRTQTGGKIMVVCAVEKRPVTDDTKYKGIDNQGYFAGGADIAVLPNAEAARIGGFIRSNVKAATRIIGDGFKSHTKSDKYRNNPIT
jgi:hypothetical protein